MNDPINSCNAVEKVASSFVHFGRLFRCSILNGCLVAFCSLVLPASLQAEVIVDFEELTLFTGTSGATDGQAGGQFYNGNDGSNASNSDGWSSNTAHFSNSLAFDPDFGGFWSGWAYSNVVNSVSPGFMNQYAAFPGGGSDGLGGVDVGGTYAVAYTGSQLNTTSSVIQFSKATAVSSLDLVNTTYLARYVMDNAPAAYPDRDNLLDGEFVRLRIEALDAGGQVIGSHLETLADFGAAGTEDDFVLVDWTRVDLSGLGLMHGLQFVVDSNVTSTFDGITYVDPPAYFAIDNMAITAVPEPGTFAALGVASLVVYVGRRRGRQKCDLRAS
ncbi:DUF4465 domain-containing protein [Planctomycetaceae bacterium SH139]